VPRNGLGFENKESKMSEQDNTGAEVGEALDALRAEAEAAVDAPDLQERVRQLTHRALLDRKLSLAELREIMAAITEGVGKGLTQRGGELRAELRRAAAGLDEAIGSTAEAISLTLSEAASHGRAYKDGELKESLARVKALEVALIEGLKDTAKQSSGKLRDELNALGEHMKTTRTDSGARVRAALETVTNSLNASARAGRSGLGEAADTAGERASSVASGVLSALSDALKRQSERLHR
jgi:hypothetical protein